jgi:hypothetical protein
MLRDNAMVHHPRESPKNHLCGLLMVIDGTIKLTHARCSHIKKDDSAEQQQLSDLLELIV